MSGLANGDSVKSWTTSNKKIVTVTSKGTIKGLKAGKAKVTITLASGKKQVINVTVQKGKKLTLKPVISPITSLQKVTYTTSNKKVATVTKKGVIKAKKKGTVTITVKSGKVTKKVKVTVK